MSFIAKLKAKVAPVGIPALALGVAALTGADIAGDIANITTLATFVTENFVQILALLSGCTLFLLVVAIKFWKQIFSIVMQLVSYLGGSGKRA
jgi:uncharacterized membrane protein